MKVLIIREMNEVNEGINVCRAMSSEMYKKYCSLMNISANHIWANFTFIDEKNEYIGTFRTMDELLKRKSFLGNVLILTQEQFLDKVNPNWKLTFKIY